MEFSGNVWEITSAITGVVALLAYLYLERDKLNALDAVALSRLKIGVLLLAIAISYWAIGQRRHGKPFPIFDVVYMLGPFHMASRIVNTGIILLIFFGLGGILGRFISRTRWSAAQKVVFLFIWGAMTGLILAVLFVSQMDRWWTMPVKDWPGYADVVFTTMIHTGIGTIIAALAVDRAIVRRHSHALH
jgi:hypothetical protein